MKQDVARRPHWRARLQANPEAVIAAAIFVVSAATLLGALFFQYVLKLPPCPLCLDERIAYHIVIPLSLLIAVAAGAGAPRTLLTAGFVVVLVTVLCGAALAAYHAGVEWHFWAGPTDCSGPLGDLKAGGSMLSQLQTINVVRCDEAAWRFLGISLAGYDALICLLMAALAAYGAVTARRSG